MDFEYDRFKEDSVKLMDFFYSNTIHIFKSYEMSVGMGLQIHSIYLPEDISKGVSSEDVVSAVLNQNDDQLTKKYILIEFARSLIFDACNNFYEAIWAIRRDNYKIAFQLIRKPLEETILHLEAIAVDIDNYIQLFKEGNPKKLFLSSHYKDEALLGLIGKVCKSIRDDLNLELFVDSDSIKLLRYDKGSKNGFYSYSQQSIHVITSHSPLYSTAPYSLNTVGFDTEPMKLLLTYLPLLLDYFRNLVLLVLNKFSCPNLIVPNYRSSNVRRAAGFHSFYKPILGIDMPVSFTFDMINELELQCAICHKILKLDRELSNSELTDFYYNGELNICCC